LRVTNLKNNKSIVVRIIDRLKSPDAIIDLSREAAEKLDMIHDGSSRVRLEVLPDNWKSSAKW
jgi:rare lipoprotein A